MLSYCRSPRRLWLNVHTWSNVCTSYIHSRKLKQENWNCNLPVCCSQPHGVPDWRVCRLHGFPFSFAGCSSSLRVPIFAWAGSEALPWLFIGSSQGPLIVSRAHLQAIGGRRRVHRRGGPGNGLSFPRALELLILNFGWTKKVQSCEKTVA